MFNTVDRPHRLMSIQLKYTLIINYTQQLYITFYRIAIAKKTVGKMKLKKEETNDFYMHQTGELQKLND